ncbi:hypothetical protein D3C76_1046390 [compost metagenome]
MYLKVMRTSYDIGHSHDCMKLSAFYGVQRDVHGIASKHMNRYVSISLKKLTRCLRPSTRMIQSICRKS